MRAAAWPSDIALRRWRRPGDQGTGAPLATGDAVALLCLRDEVKERAGEVASWLERTMYWGFLDVWEGQGLLPLAAHRLREAGLLGCLPSDVSASLAAIDAEYESIASVYLARASEVVRSLEREEIASLLLKDPRGFPRPHHRPGYDVDLLVRRGDVGQVTELLEAMGYERGRSPYRERLVDKVAAFDRYDDGLRISIDLHWHLLGGYLPSSSRVDVEGVFERQVPVAHGGTTFPCLAVEDHLVNAAMHCYQHECRWPSRLITYCDVAEAVRGTPAIDWEHVVARTREWGAETDVHLALSVATQLLGVPVPDDVLNAVSPRVHRLGIDASTYGYLNYTWKYVDKLYAVGDVDAHACATAGRDLLAGAKVLDSACTALAEALATAVGQSVLTFGEPSGSLVLSPRLPSYGAVEVLVPTATPTMVAEVLTAQGFSSDRSTRSSSGASGAWQRPLNGGPELRARVVVGGHRALGTSDRTIAWFLRRLFGWRSDTGRVTVTVRCIEPSTLPEVLLGAVGGGAVDLSSLIWAKVPHVVKGTTLSAARDSAVDGAGWSLLEALDARTNGIEALTKFVGTPEGFRVTRSLAGASSGVAGLVGALVRRRVRPRDLAAAARAIMHSRYERRVPPRGYLVRGGDTLIDWRSRRTFAGRPCRPT